MNEKEEHESGGGEQDPPLPSSGTIFNSFKYPVCVINSSGELTYRNGPFRQLFESETSTVRLDWSHPFFPEYRKRIAMAYLRALKGSDRQCFAVMKSSEGKRIPVEIYLFPLFDNSAVSSILVFLKIVDDRLLSFDQSTSHLFDEEELQYGSRLFQFSPFPILRMNRQGQVVAASISLEGLLGYTLEELKKKRTLLFRSINLYDFERLRKVLQEIFGGSISFKRIGEIMVLGRDREEKWVNAILYPLMVDNEVREVEIIFEDLTKIKKMENRLSSLNRIQIIGDLTKGVLHSFNNMISIIMSRAQLLLQVTEKEMVMEGLRVIERTAMESVKQIRRIEDFIGGGEKLTENEAENLIEVIEDAIEFAKIQFKVEEKEKRRSIKIERKYYSLFNLKTDTQLLREIFLAMIFRVSGFIGKEGTVTVELRDVGGPCITFSVPRSAEAARESIIPAGGGTAAEGESRIPGGLFYQDVDIRRMAERRNIKIIEEESPEGYSLKAVIPAKAVISAQKKEPESVEFRLRDLDILIVEDEEALKEVLFELFDGMGNRVILCDNGDEALAEFRRGRFDIVIADYGIRGIKGLELSARVKELNERTVTVLLSGWILNDLRAYKSVIDVYLPKPFKLDVLIREISRMMTARKAAAT